MTAVPAPADLDPVGPSPAITPGTAGGVGTRARWALVDAWTIAHRVLLHWARQPAVFVFGLAFPVITLTMFAYLFGGAMTVPGGVATTPSSSSPGCSPCRCCSVSSRRCSR
jgi:hypothetical protein